MENVVGRILDATPIDVVQVEFPFMAANVPGCGALKVLDAHNVEYDTLHRIAQQLPWGMRKAYYRGEYEAMRVEELRACRGQDGILVTSRRDGMLLHADVPSVPKFVIPNGVDMGYFTPSDICPEPHSLVFTGEMAYVPNYDGMLYFLDQVFPRVISRFPDTRIYVVGRRPPQSLVARASSNIIVTGCVDDVRPFVWRSSVVVVPLRMGGGTRLKVVEAMAMRKAIVSTSIGCEGIDVSHGESCFIEDDPQAFADRIVQLLQDRRLREHIAANARELVGTRYEWSVIGKTLRRAYGEIMEARNVPSHHTRQRAHDFTPGRNGDASVSDTTQPVMSA
jgi:glycosyltransferase involved in cell wall biosynthesis